MSDDELAGDDGAWGPPVPEAAFEDEPQRPRAPMGTNLGDTLETAGDGADAVADAAADLAVVGLPIDVAALLDTLATLKDQVPYKLGGKPSSLKLTTEQFLAERRVAGVDCSGFVRWLAYRASNGRVTIHDGTFGERDDFRAYADAVHVPCSPYTDCARTDGVLRVAGFVKSNVVSVGHIWFVHDGLTGESHGHHGVDRRAWNTPALLRLATWCFPLARLAPVG